MICRHPIAKESGRSFRYGATTLATRLAARDTTLCCEVIGQRGHAGKYDIRVFCQTAEPIPNQPRKLPPVK
jgi:hypothetical protein